MEKQKRCDWCKELTFDWELIGGRCQCWECGRIARMNTSERIVYIVERAIISASTYNESIKKGE